MPWKDLTTDYEHQGLDLFRLWICPCGGVLREDNLTDLQISQELGK